MSEQPLVAWSFSRLDSFETCPRKYWHQSVEKDIKEEKNEQQIAGEEAHLAFKMYFKVGQALPLHLRQYEQYLRPIAAAPGDKICEQQIALNSSFQQVEWYAKDAYLRVISDLTQHNGKAAVIWDWKFGKPHEKFDQLKLTAAVTFLLGPEIERITMAYFWAKTKTVSPHVMTRDQTATFWAEIQPRVQKYQDAHVAKDFPPKPNWLCKGYCPVTSCQYWERGRKR